MFDTQISTVGLGDRTCGKLPCIELLFGMQPFVGLSVYNVCENFCDSVNLLAALVGSLVQKQAVSPYKALLTDTAHIGLLSSVCQFVCRESVLVSEALLTDRADKGLLTGVCPLVRPEGRPLGKAFVTDVAG